MGYLTRFKLSYPAQYAGEVDRYMLDLDRGTYLRAAWEEDGEEYKWYNHDDDMLNLSLQIPGCLFTLWGEGEDAGDLWVKYYRDGKTCGGHAQIVYPEFKEEDLR